MELRDGSGLRPAVEQSCSLDEELTRFPAFLGSRGHPPSTVAMYAGAAAHFVRWLREHHSRTRFATQERVDEFLYGHLPRCRCATSGTRDLKTVRAALRRFQAFVNPCEEAERRGSTKASPVEVELDEYHDYLRQTCGLAEATCTYRMRYVAEFLRRVGVSRASKRVHIGAPQVIEYVSRRATAAKPGTVRVIGGSIRSYLRWQQLRGLVDPVLLTAIPRVPQRRLAELPRALSSSQLGQLLHSFDRSPSGRRDLAMARCMAGMGLRASEVAKLTLADIDWREGTVRVPSTKCRRVRLLPLPPRPGGAIACYLRYGRPATDSPQLFVRHRIPIGRALTPELVRGAMRRAYARAAFPSTWTGTHLLRHTAATLMLQKGATLKQIADVLGHRSIDTTTIYTKVNLPVLRAVALRWPEVGA
jgi:integrase/recombinase XerD